MINLIWPDQKPKLTHDKTQVKNQLIFFKTFWSKQGYFDYFSLKIRLIKLTIPTRDLNFSSGQIQSRVLRLW
jgi:hypothetical protein